MLVTPDELILRELNPKLGKYAQRKIWKRGVEILIGVKVSAFRKSMVELTSGARIPARCLIWTAGLGPSLLIAAAAAAEEE